jgi:hypothetical protein
VRRSIACLRPRVGINARDIATSLSCLLIALCYVALHAYTSPRSSVSSNPRYTPWMYDTLTTNNVFDAYAAGAAASPAQLGSASALILQQRCSSCRCCASLSYPTAALMIKVWHQSAACSTCRTYALRTSAEPVQRATQRCQQP